MKVPVNKPNPQQPKNLLIHNLNLHSLFGSPLHNPDSREDETEGEQGGDRWLRQQEKGEWEAKTS